jgi:hypothetical protein
MLFGDYNIYVCVFAIRLTWQCGTLNTLPHVWYFV